MNQKEAAAEAAAEWWASKLQRGNRQAFKDTLRAAVLDALDKRGSIYLDCDYDPRGPLLDAVRSAGNACAGAFFSADGILPRKHALTVYPGHMEPKEGYANWLDDIQIPAAGDDA